DSPGQPKGPPFFAARQSIASASPNSFATLFRLGHFEPTG
ncbi:16897_t:CDS:1, partial [Dentiscutata heterogama]